MASVAGDVLLGKEKVQKILLSRLTETVVMWLSDEQEFWDVFENDTAQLQPSGLQQVPYKYQFLLFALNKKIIKEINKNTIVLFL